MWKPLWYFVGALVVVGAQEELPEGEPSEQGRILSGIHDETLPSPIFYESYIPIVLDYKTPKWNKTDIVFNNWYTCWSDTAPYRYSCPVAFHMNSAVVNLHVDFEGLHPIQDADEQAEVQRLAKSHFSRLVQSSEFCSKIQRHFQGLWTHSEDFEGYVEALENCQWDAPVRYAKGENYTENLLAPLVERSIGQFNYSIRLPFTRMENNFYNTFYRHIITGAGVAAGGSLLANNGTTANSSTTSPTLPSPGIIPQRPNLDLVASALLSNARTTLQGAILGLYYAEKNRWVHANQDCAAQMIPTSLVTRDKFNSTLRKVEEKLSRVFNEYNFYYVNSKSKEELDDFDLAIPRGSLSQYYSLPLTDCTHTNDDSLVVRIQVPLIKRHRGTSLSLRRVHNLPFQYKDHLCRLRINSGDNLRGNSHGFENAYNGGGSSGSSAGFVHSSRLFIYNEMTGLAFSTDCKEATLCKISEYGLNPKNSDPCVSALLAKNRPGILKSCHFHCSNVEGGSDSEGSGSPIVTRIRANAYILTGNYMKFQVKCKRKVPSNHFFLGESEERTGALWVSVPCRCKLIVDGKYVFHGEGGSGECEKEKVAVYPVMPLHFGRVKKSKEGGSDGDFYADKVGDSVFVNLADYLDEERLEGYLRNAAERKGVKTGKVTSGESGRSESSSSTSVIVLWVVFVVVAILLGGLQGYILYLLKRQERLGYLKDDQRILYKVPDSPVLY